MKLQNRRYCLMLLGFGLNFALLIMKAIVKAILIQQPEIARAVLPYVNDLVNKDLVSTDWVAVHFAAFGQGCKQPDRAVDGARLLGLHVWATGGELH